MPMLLEQVVVVKETVSTEAAEVDPAKKRTEFIPVLAIAVLQSRWLRTFATPCHARGASI